MSSGRVHWVSQVLALLTLMPAVALGQTGSGADFRFRPPSATLTLHGGFAAPSARSDLFAFTTEELTVSRSDFLTGTLGADLSLSLGERLELVLGIARGESETRSEFRDWVDNNSFPIEQTTRFRRTPITASLRYNLVPRGRTVGRYAWVPSRIVPFVGVGAGVMAYRFEQVGDFINTTTLAVFAERFEQQATAGVLQLSGGASWNLNPYLQFTGEVRYLRGRGERSGSGDDFVGFERLDLSGVSTLFGLTLRF